MMRRREGKECPITPAKSESVQVRGTGGWSSGSKLASIENGLWDDPFFKTFNGNRNSVPKRTSLICRGYYVRFRVCDYFIRKLILSLPEPVQIVALGGGLDTLFFRLNADYGGKLSRFYDVDFPSVVQRKLEIVKSNVELSDISQGRLFIVPGDLRCMDAVSLSLNAAGFDSSIPTIFYTECVVNYLSPSESDNILSWITKNVPQSVYLSYEQANPHDSFGRIMVDHFKKNGCPILSVKPNGSLKLQHQQLERHKFKFCYVVNAWDAFLNITKEELCPLPSSPELQFDEYEALLGTCLHYSVRIGITQHISPINLQLPNPFDPSTIPKIPGVVMVDNERVFSGVSSLKTKGHASIQIGNNIYIIGGTDQTSRSQPAISEITASLETNVPQVTVQLSKILENDIFKRSYAAAAYSPVTSALLLHGGRGSPLSPQRSQLIQILLKTPHSLTSDQITVLDPMSGEHGVEFPSPRWRHALTCFNDKTGNDAIFLFGGKTIEGTCNDAWIFRLAEKTWENLPLPLSTSSSLHEYPSPRHSHAICRSKRRSIFVIGGVSANDIHLCEDAVWEFHYDKQKWTRWIDFDGFGRKVGHVILEHGDLLYVVGGYGNDSDTTLHTFITTLNFFTREVQIYELHLESTHLFLPFDFSAHVLSPNGTSEEYLVVIGGGGNCFSFGSHYNTNYFFIKLPLPANA